MNWRHDFGCWHFHIGLSKSGKVQGVCSNLPDGKHFLMWDFDNKSLEEVIDALVEVQIQFRLPQMYVINTGLEAHYHAYCFKAFDWAATLYILASTRGNDEVYFKIGVVRRFFTLRYTPKRRRAFTLESIIPSVEKEDVNPYDVPSLVRYWTKRL